MTATQESSCTQLIFYDASSAPSQKELKEAVEKGDTAVRIAKMKQIIMLHLNGEPQNALVMTFIRFVLPSQDHVLKKLALYFLEIMDKTDAGGKLLPEMILVCSFLRNDLTSPNEYVRGCTLRFVCKLREEELVEPLTDAIIDNLQHRHSYVRRNAALAVFSVYQRFPHLLPDAPDTMEKFLDSESDPSSKRNAFIMLFNCAQEHAIRWFRRAIDVDIIASGDIFQLAIVDLLKHLCKKNPQEKPTYLRVIFQLLNSKSSAVLFQCASTLLTLSSSPTAIKEAANTFVHLLNTHSDNNVRLIVLQRLEDIKKRFPELLSEALMDLLRTLSIPHMDIRKKVLELSLDMVSSSTAEKVLQFLKKELIKSQAENDGDKATKHDYRQTLVRSIHTIAIKFPATAPAVVPVMLDYIVEPVPSAVDVMLFIREVITKQPSLQEDILHKLTTLFPQIHSSRVLRTTLWILGVHSKTVEQTVHVLETIKSTLQPFPLLPEEKIVVSSSKSGENGDEDGQEEEKDGAVGGETGGASAMARTAGIAVREDGTYVTTLHETAASSNETLEQPFRTLLVSGDFFLAAVLCNTLAKLVVNVQGLGADKSAINSVKADAMDIVGEVLRMGTRSSPPIDDDTHERIQLCQQLMLQSANPFTNNLLDQSRTALSEMLAAQSEPEDGAEQTRKFVPVDAPVTFSQLMKSRLGRGANIDIEMEDVTVAVTNQVVSRGSTFLSQLNRVMQLTGFSDPIYCEATVTVHQFDILLDVLVVNQTQDTMQNLTVELATVGDLKLCERPHTYTLAPHESVSIKANIKVSSTETGIIFGSVVYDTASAANERSCVILNDVHIDIMDYISPASCPATQFRSMWAEFEWENKVAVNTTAKYVHPIFFYC
eukprot:TRINITY_DN65928_c6_g4_i2.p1 TRINITY_DN65928_c6_g4~~TRINITY_DN65928_c6_g4_i2.p1  ORF type:complete len:882 (-),score=148.70 TRINITY_DN65928_c6_g4_i2:166-2811(-)